MKKNISQKNIELIKQFILNTENFWEDHKIINLDYKHRKILKTFNKKYKDNLELFSKQIINWEGQTDQGHPYQINLKSIKYYGFTKNILDGLKYIYQIISKKNYDRNSFIDDIEIIKLKKGVNFFNKIDISSRPDKPPIYFSKENFETNNRWNRYVYLASRIINSKLLNSKSKNWLDIGSYFGGLQSILKKDLKNPQIILSEDDRKNIESAVFDLQNLTLPQNFSQNLNEQRELINQGQKQLAKIAENLILQKVNAVLSKKISGKNVDEL
jgi:hypothetical protein